jgi:hypothetical protein
VLAVVLAVVLVLVLVLVVETAPRRLVIQFAVPSDTLAS